jgi:hypothetical protein
MKANGKIEIIIVLVKIYFLVIKKSIGERSGKYPPPLAPPCRSPPPPFCSMGAKSLAVPPGGTADTPMVVAGRGGRGEGDPAGAAEPTSGELEIYKSLS